MSSSKNAIFDDYLKTHTAVKGSGFTNTRIGDKKLNIYGGSYQIADGEWSDFIKKYFQHVFVKGKMEYLTEKQLIEDGPVLIDIDLRYERDITKKQHTTEHIQDMILLYADKIAELMEVKEGVDIDIYVMEKSDVNITDNKTKDGIHVIFGVKMHKALQVILRNKVLPELKGMWDDLPITNTWEDVLDEGVTRGFVNWQMYGSRKPGNLAYMIKHHYIISYNKESDCWESSNDEIKNFSTEKNIEKLSARYNKHPEFEIKESVKELFEKTKESLNKHQPNTNNADSKLMKGKPKLKFKVNGTDCEYNEINSEEVLDGMLDRLFEDVGPSNYKIKETHQYTMSLPVSYYGPGSYSNWIRVGWALANTKIGNEKSKMFLTWLKFSCQENCRDTLKGNDGKFDWKCVSELYETWCKFEFNNPDGLTYRSIMYWCKRDAREKYNEIHKDTVDYFMEQSIMTLTEFDLASVLYHLYKDNFICASIKHTTWYEYNHKHRWVENDEGTSLRQRISREMYKVYFDKTQEVANLLQTMEQTTEGYEGIRDKSKNLSLILIYLKKTTWKNNIMKEAKELFYDREFIEKLDQNPYLLCFNNYVVDFKNNTYRKGQPDDYISKCTNVDYIPYKTVMKNSESVIAEINEFMEQLFPIEELRNYMWEHAASCLIGTNHNQTFNIYKGSGRNGKSKFVELMSHSLGSYKGTVPITLITSKRNNIGSTSSEVAQLNAVRYAVMQEPSKGDKINEGIMKEITGGDPIQARALFKDTITFVPQFKLVVCTNTDFDDMASDDGTWRRIRMIDFMSKMLEVPYEDPKFPKEEFPYQFPVDKNLDSKFKTWAPIFMSILVEKSFKLQGIVSDCKIVMASSEQYRDRQDYFSGFAKDKIRSNPGEKIKKTELLQTFKEWYSTNYGSKGMPPGKEIYEFMDKRYGDFKQGWRNISIIYNEDENDPLDEC
jgi:P4 family phage/plasmid primase-like protien